MGLTGCTSSDFASASLSTVTPAATSVATPTKAKARPAASTTGPTTSTLGPLPKVLSSSASPVDANVITALGDLPAAFGCPKVPEPIVVRGTEGRPAHIVCRSALAGEALFLWYVADADAKFRAVAAAMDRARYVHAGERWVAGGMVDPTMGTVGGQVFKR